MPTLLFWNIHKRKLSGSAAALARDVRADIVVLTECAESIGTILKEFNSNGSPFYEPDPGFPDRLIILSRYPSGAVVPVRDALGISVRHYAPPIGSSFLLAAVHLPSKRYETEQGQSFLSVRIARVIREAEEHVGHSRTLVIGDFNMNPFEPGMVGAEGLHAIMDRRIASQVVRTVRREDYPFFYNPMWGHFGDGRGGAPGSYFYNSGAHVNFFWHIFDQVLLRPAVLPFFADEDLKIVTDIRGASLLNSAGRPDAKNFSDHLPLVVKLRDIEREEVDVN